MLTVEDIRKLAEVFATKEELRQEIMRIEEKMATKDQLDRVMNLVDAVLGEVKAMRQEQSIHRQEHDDIGERVVTYCLPSLFPSKNVK